MAKSSRLRHRRDVLRALDRLLDVDLRQSAFGGQALARLAATLAIEQSGADRGILLLNDGRNLMPILSLDSNLDRTKSAHVVFDEQLVREAQRTQELVAGEGRIAAPVLVNGRPEGVFYLESDHGRLGRWTRQITGDVVLRIGTLLQRAELLNELSRRTLGMEQLARLGAQLASGQIETPHLDLALDAALEATDSDQAILAQVSESGHMDPLLLRGGATETLRTQAEKIAACLDAEEVRSSEDAPRSFQLLEALGSGILERSAESPPRPVGFVLVRRTGNIPYQTADRAFLRALAHLISAGLARQEFFDRATEDPVTSTGTRLALQLGLAEAQARAEKTGQPFSIILADVDRFKEVNDRYHHLVGDAVLRSVANVLRSRLRDQDSVSRYGGDEFVIILPDTSGEGAEQLAEELCDLVSRRRHSEDRLSITVSLGVATFLPAADTVEDVLRLADDALYSSKTHGRNRVTVAVRRGPSC